jgi:hypothetical protein
VVVPFNQSVTAVVLLDVVLVVLPNAGALAVCGAAGPVGESAQAAVRPATPSASAGAPARSARRKLRGVRVAYFRPVDMR